MNDQFSYTLYDELGRVKEAGQKDENSINSVAMKSIFGSLINGYYNVKTLVQDQPAMAIHENELAQMRFKRMDYTYDLISGNVHEVNYQDGKTDAMHHHYLYDADNRITDVFTSTEAHPLDDFYAEAVGWTQDASYRYYQHGSLARVELGEHLVQGIDYAYTLQGWLKGVNSEDLNPDNDMGGDARENHFHANVAKDAFSLSLGYFEGDYNRINTSAPSWQGATGGDLIANREDLGMVTLAT
ncbi:MAG: hypothetical protein R2809_13035 [Flavobacteriales bacterium]